MPLEHLGHPNSPIKITDIVTIPQKEEVLDPMAEMYDEDVFNIFLEMLEKKRLLDEYAPVVALIQTFPEKRKVITNLCADIITTLTYRIQSRMKKAHRNRMVLQLRRELRYLNIILGDAQPNAAPTEPPNDVLEAMSEGIAEKLDKKDWYTFMQFVSELAFISPQKASEFLNRPGVFESCKSIVASDAAIILLRTLFPARFSAKQAAEILNLKIKERKDAILADAAKIKDDVKAGRFPNALTDYVNALLDYKILTADHLKITRTGIVFSDGIAPSFDKEIPPLPELKK